MGFAPEHRALTAEEWAEDAWNGLVCHQTPEAAKASFIKRIAATIESAVRSDRAQGRVYPASVQECAERLQDHVPPGEIGALLRTLQPVTSNGQIMKAVVSMLLNRVNTLSQELQKEVQERALMGAAHEKNLKSLNQNCGDHDRQIAHLKDRCDALSTLATEKNRDFASLQHQVAAHDRKQQARDEIVADSYRLVREMQDSLQSVREQVGADNNQLTKVSAELAKLRNDIRGPQHKASARVRAVWKALRDHGFNDGGAVEQLTRAIEEALLAE